MLELSVVIPVLDEVDYLGPCLDRLLDQEGDIDEIIVVDNGSSDGTCELVERYRQRTDKIVLIHEAKRGVVHARNAGFERASGDVLGRIDADTRVRPGWARSVKSFLQNEPSYAAVAGTAYLYESPWASAQHKLHDREVAQWGPVRSMVAASGNNFAIRHSAWEAVRDNASCREDLHEDIDLSLCLRAKELPLAQYTEMRVELSGRRGITSPARYYFYARAGYRAYKRHGLESATLRRVVFVDWLMHSLRWPVCRLVGKGASRPLPVRQDQQAQPVTVG